MTVKFLVRESNEAHKVTEAADAKRKITYDTRKSCAAETPTVSLELLLRKHLQPPT